MREQNDLVPVDQKEAIFEARQGDLRQCGLIMAMENMAVNGMNIERRRCSEKEPRPYQKRPRPHSEDVRVRVDAE